MGKVRLGMIGAGVMANRVHYPSLASFGDVEIAAVCDIDWERLHTTADKYGVERRYLDYRKMVEEVAPDAVYVIGQPHIMYDIWVWCLQQGLNLYIEKPMGITLHQARVLAYIADQKGCLTQVSFQRRASPMVSLLRDQCLKRGPVFHAVCSFYKFLIQPHLDARDHMTDYTLSTPSAGCVVERWSRCNPHAGVSRRRTSTSSRPCSVSTTALPV